MPVFRTKEVETFGTKSDLLVRNNQFEELDFRFVYLIEHRFHCADFSSLAEISRLNPGDAQEVTLRTVK